MQEHLDGRIWEEELMNKYSKYFRENMTSDEARCKYFLLVNDISKNGIETEKEKEELMKAYKPIQEKILDREIKEAFEKGKI